MTIENTDTVQNPEKSAKGNGQSKAQGAKPRVISRPEDVAGLVMMQIDAVNAKKDERTIAVKGLADTAKQLVRAYTQQATAIEKLSKRVKDVEGKSGAKKVFASV
jgi:hypothetical protein